MSLGVAPRTPTLEVAAFVSEQLHAFDEAFVDLFRLEAPVEIGFSADDPRGSDGAVSVAVATPPRQLCDMLPEAVSINRVHTTFAVRAAMRDGHGAVEWRWLPGTGRVWLTGARRERASRDDPPQGAAWRARVFVDVLSLFRVDNQEKLGNARRLWSELRAEHSGMTTFFDVWPKHEEVPYAGIVTLAVPPPGTPRDNRELSELNVPRLRTAVTRWEQATGNPFQWTEP
jgi:hypothetical protein